MKNGARKKLRHPVLLPREFDRNVLYLCTSKTCFRAGSHVFSANTTPISHRFPQPRKVYACLTLQEKKAPRQACQGCRVRKESKGGCVSWRGITAPTRDRKDPSALQADQVTADRPIVCVGVGRGLWRRVGLDVCVYLNVCLLQCVCTKVYFNVFKDSRTVIVEAMQVCA